MGVKAQLTKLASGSLCSNTMGQVAMGPMVNPPTSGPELKAYEKEKKEKLASLERRANKVAAALDALEGVSCVRPQGAMYLFPSITLPDAAVKAANGRRWRRTRSTRSDCSRHGPGHGARQRVRPEERDLALPHDVPARREADRQRRAEARGLPRVVPGQVRRRRRALKRGCACATRSSPGYKN